MQVNTFTKSLPSTLKVQQIAMMLGESDPLFTFVDQVVNRPKSSYRSNMDVTLENKDFPNSVYDLVSLAQDSDYNAMVDFNEFNQKTKANLEMLDKQDLNLISLAHLAINNTDININYLNTITTPNIITNISHMTEEAKDHYRIQEALKSDIILHALVFYDLQRHDVTIIQGPPPILPTNHVHWNEYAATRLFSVDGEVSDILPTLLHQLSNYTSDISHMSPSTNIYMDISHGNNSSYAFNSCALKNRGHRSTDSRSFTT